MLVCVIDGVRPLTANEKHRGTWRQHRDREQQIKALARADARTRHRRRDAIHGPVVATLVVTPPDRRRRDLDGWTPTLKRCLDGVVQAGVLTDDHSGVVTEVRIRATPPGPAWRLELHLHRPGGAT